MKKLVFLFFLFLAPLVVAKDYAVSVVQLDYYLNYDGTVNVTERISYDLDGQFTELYRQLPPDMKISNESGYCINKKCQFYTQMNQGYYELVLKSSYGNEKVTIVFNYIVDGQILEQKDAAQFFYKLWGDQWEKSIGKLEATIHMPDDASQTSYFIHPPYDSIKSTTSGNNITITSLNHPSKTYLEMNLLMPQSWFSNLPKATKYMTKQEIETGEKSYIQNEKTKGLVIWILFGGLVLLLPMAYFLLYIKYGREKPLSQLQFLAPYEWEAPGDLTPAEAQFLVDRATAPNTVSAEILWLVQKKYLIMEEKEIEVSKFLVLKGKEKRIVFTINDGKNTDTLKPHQQSILSFIKKDFDGRFVVEELKNKQLEYRTFYNKFIEEVKKSFDEKKYLNQKGNN